MSSDGKYYIVTGVTDKDVTEIKIPKSYKNLPVAGIGKGAFNGCKSLKDIEMHSGIHKLDQDAFEGLDSIVFNEYDNGFYIGYKGNPYLVLVKAKNTNITSCKIPSGTMIIYHFAFANCKKLEVIEADMTRARWESLLKGDKWDNNIGNYVVYCTDDESVAEHEHSFTNYKFDNNATCTEDGTQTAKCDYCNATNTVVELGTARHIFGKYVSNNDATCTEYGTSSAKCERCDTIDISYNRSYPPLGHDITVHEGKTATCTEIGWSEYETCSRCDHSTYEEISALGHSYTMVGYDSANHWNTCIRCAEKNNVENHSFDGAGRCDCGYGCDHQVGTAATCKKQATCSICGNLYGGLAEHTSVNVSAVAATCTESGLTEGTKCSVCNIVLTPQRIVSAKGHSWGDYVSNNDATCTEDGTKTAVCNRTDCKETDTLIDIGTKLQHSFTNYVSNKDAQIGVDGTKTAKCDGCDITDTIQDVGSAKTYSNGLEFTLNYDEESYSVTGIGTCTDADLIIPPTHENLLVTRISAYAFYDDCLGVTSITIPDSVTSIGECAFFGCTGLTSITIPNSVTIIGEGAFGNCISLSEVYIRDIAAWCNIDFCGYNVPSPLNLGTSCKLYLNGTVITELVIPEGVTEIPAYAFCGQSSITSVKIPASVTKIGEKAFYSCGHLTEVYISDIAAWCNIDFDIYSSHSPLLGYKDNLYFNNALITELVIPEGVTEIPAYAFYGQSSIISVTIPNSVTSIGSYAFQHCSGITNISISNNVTSIGISAFSRCTNLNYNEYDNAYYIGNENNPYAVLMKEKDTSITSCEINSNTKVICDHAFVNCLNLTSIEIPASVTNIGGYAFGNCQGLGSIEIPSGVTIIDKGAFSGCTGLTNVTFEENSRLESIVGSAFAYCNLLENIEIPNSVTSIGPAAFEGCKNLTNITIPNSVTSIGIGAFSGCTNLNYNEYDNAYYLGNEDNPYIILVKSTDDITSCEINNNTKFIHSCAFSGNRKLTSVKIPASVTDIGALAFHNSFNLLEVQISDMAAWCNIDFEEAYSNPLYSAKKLYLNGSLITELIIPEGVTEISDYAFWGFSSITSVTIPSTVTSIGTSAFYGCTGLESVTIGNSVESIGIYAFSGCTNITSITFENPNDLWYVSASNTATSGTSVDVSNANQNAINLADTYKSCYWKRYE